MDFLNDKDNLKIKHLDFKVGKILLLLAISIKKTLLFGSSIILSNALIELTFKNSMLSIRTNLGFEFKDDLLRLFIKIRI